MDRASAGLQERLEMMPNAIRNWMPANSASVRIGWWSTIDAFQVTTRWNHPGFPDATPPASR